MSKAEGKKKPQVEPEQNGESEEVVEEVRTTRQTTSEGSKRRTKRPTNPSALSSKPNIKSYIRQRGELCPFSTHKGTKTVNRSSSVAVSDISAISMKDNKQGRLICEIAVIVAAACKHRTVDREHVLTAKTILNMVSRDLLAVNLS